MKRKVGFVAAIVILLGFLTPWHGGVVHADTSSNVTEKAAHGSSDTNGFSVKICPTYGSSGAKRPTEYIAGDMFCANIVVVGLKPKPDRNTHFLVRCDLFDASGKLCQKFIEGAYQPVQIYGLVGIRGQVEAGVLDQDLKPGQYEVRTTVRDVVAGSKAEDRLPITILPKDTSQSFPINP